MKSHILKLGDAAARQTERDTSFIGGIPRLPGSMDLPSCTLCGALQTFFFVVAFPDDLQFGVYAGHSLAVFACTSCYDQDHVIPFLFNSQNPNIPAGFFDSYYTNFRFIVFETERADVRVEYTPRIKFKRWRLESTDRKSQRNTNKLGGNPDWYGLDESPGYYAGTVPMRFLAQTREYMVFETVPDAPGQMQWTISGSIEPVRDGEYTLFMKDALRFFGTDSPDRLVYLVMNVS